MPGSQSRQRGVHNAGHEASRQRRWSPNIVQTL